MTDRFVQPEDFAPRHNGPAADEQAAMLTAIGADSIDQLISETVPAKIQQPNALELPPPYSEAELLDYMAGLAARNQRYKSFIGQGYYGTFLPPVIQRNVLENPGWYTQYTPYQAEIAQGRLEALVNFQTMVIDLTGMEIANASLLDEGTAAAEAMTLMYNRTRKAKRGEVFLVDEGLHPQTLSVLQTRAEPFGIEVRPVQLSEAPFTEDVFGLYVQYPDTSGAIYDHRALVEAAHAENLLVAFGADLLALTLLTPPGELGADIVVGSAQRFGVPMGYGGPHAAFFATREAFKRNVPGRMAGVSVDSSGRPAYRLALQTREQHIRREKATSNICTAQVLLAIISSMYAVYHGPQRLKAKAERVHGLTRLLNKQLGKLGYTQRNAHFFDTLRVELVTAESAAKLKQATEAAGINLRYFADHSAGIALDETTRPEDVEALLQIFAGLRGAAAPSLDGPLNGEAENLQLPEALVRKSDYLTHEVFHSYHTETEMLRYLKRLENRDLSLTQSMIPLGSCTMKLNATAELMPLSFPGFSELHPFVPTDQAEGYAAMHKHLEELLCAVTGFEAASLMPNSGAQGEFTGLMVIREYLQAKGEGHRNVALIPSSAHGTNPASAVMAGMKVVIVTCDERGNIDLDDLRTKAEKHAGDLAALMVTYPSTHGVFEDHIKDVCQLIHTNGGQVYMDGANLNAQLGVTNPALLGADVCHLNLHKTFCIPHGGGGPGMGPIAVGGHLAPFLPAHPLSEDRGGRMGAVAAAPYGSASILTISYAYMLMMGAQGLTEATHLAILNANYVKARLDGAYPVLYQGDNGRVAHELIIDTRPFKQSAGIEVEDIAKRLIDYGYHAPTMSWPVPGTLMIEPTESENKAEMDRFCEAMLAIREEIRAIENGEADADDNLLKNAPHTAEVVIAGHWPHPYGREQAAYPLPFTRFRKFWPATGRVDNSYGDRNLVCTCPPIESFYSEEERTEAETPAIGA